MVKSMVLNKILQHRFLFEELVKRDFTKKYKRTVLGVGWSMLSPLINLLIMWVIFSNFFGNEMEHYVIYLFAGQLVFGCFTESNTTAMDTLILNAPIYTKVNIPKYLFLLSQNFSSLINFMVTLAVFFLFVLLDGVAVTWRVVLLLYPIGCMILFNLGLGLILSALFVFFRDMKYLWSLMTQLIMWMSAIFYTTDSFPPWLRNLFYLNPVYVFITYFRRILLEGAVPGAGLHLLCLAYSLISLGIGAWMYKRYNHEFLYYV